MIDAPVEGIHPEFSGVCAIRLLLLAGPIPNGTVRTSQDGGAS